MSESAVQKKLQTAAAKVVFAKEFPGRLKAWESAIGKTVEKTFSLELNQMVIFSDGSFITVPADPQPADLIRLLLAARPDLNQFWGEAFTELDQWISKDRELQRMARLENILGAIRNNMPQIPELKEALHQLLEKE